MRCEKCGNEMEIRKNVWHCWWCGNEKPYKQENKSEEKFKDVDELLK